MKKLLPTLIFYGVYFVIIFIVFVLDSGNTLIPENAVFLTAVLPLFSFLLLFNNVLKSKKEDSRIAPIIIHSLFCAIAIALFLMC